MSQGHLNGAVGQRPPLIGICAAPERARWSVWDQEALLVPRSYVAAVARAGALSLLLAPDERAADVPELLLALIDGLLLVGGADIDPASYGAQRHPQTAETCPQRDAFEIALSRAAIAQGVPLLGICRGMQLLNVALGGTLVQHVPELPGCGEHRRSLGSFSEAGHLVETAAGTLAERILGRSHCALSHHHQAVERVGAGLIVSARSRGDQLIEAIELPGADFVLGVQWHPEADPASPVIAALVDAARARSCRGALAGAG
ncbi:MAG TPA: gamma-glutamyl-gamma-aminobutyrate hydrolase family protein [Solirubrobacteraceae bacterium]|nr:gamma-glutamyl-gamma-aminobutyrate hydrolase family protein [Solirubrobacteraceae bacterium]